MEKTEEKVEQKMNQAAKKQALFLACDKLQKMVGSKAYLTEDGDVVPKGTPHCFAAGPWYGNQKKKAKKNKAAGNDSLYEKLCENDFVKDDLALTKLKMTHSQKLACFFAACDKQQNVLPVKAFLDSNAEVVPQGSQNSWAAGRWFLIQKNNVKKSLMAGDNALYQTLSQNALVKKNLDRYLAKHDLTPEGEGEGEGEGEMADE
jgi:hypothetical protein